MGKMTPPWPTQRVNTGRLRRVAACACCARCAAMRWTRQSSGEDAFMALCTSQPFPARCPFRRCLHDVFHHSLYTLILPCIHSCFSRFSNFEQARMLYADTSKSLCSPQLLMKLCLHGHCLCMCMIRACKLKYHSALVENGITQALCGFTQC